MIEFTYWMTTKHDKQITTDGSCQSTWHEGWQSPYNRENLPPLSTQNPFGKHCFTCTDNNSHSVNFHRSKLKESLVKLLNFVLQLLVNDINYLWWFLPGLFQRTTCVPALLHRAVGWRTTGAEQIHLGLDWYTCKCKKPSTSSVVTVKYENGEIILKE